MFRDMPAHDVLCRAPRPMCWTLHAQPLTLAAPVFSVGFTPSFRQITLNASFFSIIHLARIASNDFVRHPTLMMAAYLELSSAVESMSRSGQLSKGGVS